MTSGPGMMTQSQSTAAAGAYVMRCVAAVTSWLDVISVDGDAPDVLCSTLRDLLSFTVNPDDGSKEHVWSDAVREVVSLWCGIALESVTKHSAVSCNPLTGDFERQLSHERRLHDLVMNFFIAHGAANDADHKGAVKRAELALLELDALMDDIDLVSYPGRKSASVLCVKLDAALIQLRDQSHDGERCCGDSTTDCEHGHSTKGTNTLILRTL